LTILANKTQQSSKQIIWPIYNRCNQESN